MAELLVRNITDGKSLRGDVITAQANGWNWSPKELAGNPWTVIKFPGGTLEAATPYLIGGYVGEGQDMFLVEFRASYFDLDMAGVAAGDKVEVLAGGNVEMLSYRKLK